MYTGVLVVSGTVQVVDLQRRDSNPTARDFTDALDRMNALRLAQRGWDYCEGDVCQVWIGGSLAATYDGELETWRVLIDAASPPATTTSVRPAADAMQLVRRLMAESAWFQAEPWPNDEWAITVKLDRASLLETRP
jgi:hypothetical protein